MVKNQRQQNSILMKYGIGRVIQIQLFILVTVVMLMKIWFVHFSNHTVM
jgi:hypothetical protein